MSAPEDDPLSPEQKRGPIAWMVRQPVAANLLMILLLAGGLWTALTIQKEVFPQFQLDIVTVSVEYPGASPAEVEQGILLPIEEAVKGVQGIREMTSTAREGSGEVSIELVSGTERMKAFQDIDQAVNRIRTFPDDIEAPEVIATTARAGLGRGAGCGIGRWWGAGMSGVDVVDGRPTDAICVP